MTPVLVCDVRRTRPQIDLRAQPYASRGGKPASRSAATICSCDAAVSTFTTLLGGSVSMLASGSTDWIALVTVRAHPPQVMLSM
jgi:hypothetical protein